MRWSFFLFLLGACVSLKAAPQLKALTFSTYSVFDYWEGENLAWQSPETAPLFLGGFKLGAAVQLFRGFGVYLSLPLQYASAGTDTLMRPEVVPVEGGYQPVPEGWWLRLRKPEVSQWSVGDLEIALARPLGKWKVSFQYWMPTGYNPRERRFEPAPGIGSRENSGVLYNTPWKGFGVHRVAQGLSYSRGSQYLSAKLMLVAYRPTGEKKGLVESGDFSLSIFYSKFHRFNDHWVLKPSIAAKYSKFNWSGVDSDLRTDATSTASQEEPDDERIDLTITPGLSLNFKPQPKREIALSAYFSLFGKNFKSPDDIPPSKKITLGLYYGLYF